MKDDDLKKSSPNEFFGIGPDPVALNQVRPKSILRTREWGLMTIASLLASFAFPPYFITVMTLAFLNAGGLLWVTHLSEKGRQRLRDFESEFREGHHYEEKEMWVEAVGIYLSLIPRYGDIAQLAALCQNRVDKIKKLQPRYFPSPKSLQKKSSRKRK